MTGSPTKYRRCLVLAGGGGRLGVHLGAYQAACEAGVAPDVVLGTCGGALIAALVHALPDAAEQRAWLSGPELYAFWCSVRVRRGGRSPLIGAVQRLLDPRLAPTVPELDAEAMFERGSELPSLRWRAVGDTPDAVIVGARLLTQPHDVGTSRGSRPLYETVLIGPPRATARVDGVPSTMRSGVHAGSAIAEQVGVRTPHDITLDDAVTISTTDLIYLPPVTVAGERWLGGAVDLMPVEMARLFADEVWIDRKDMPNRLSLGAAWRAIFGVNASARQRDVDAMHVAVRLEHRGIVRAVPSLMPRRLRWGGGRPFAEPVPAASVADYRRVMLAQIEEGRRRCHAVLAARGLRETLDSAASPSGSLEVPA
jgi:hypothetical protein